jgi:hypothetical protein
MPIVYVHGVSVRQDPPYPPQTEVYLRQLIAPALAPDDPGGVEIVRANWFADAVRLAWNGRSIPAARSALLDEQNPASWSAPEQSGPERAIAVAELGAALAGIRAGPGGRLLDAGGPPPAPRLSDFSPDELSSFLTAVLESGGEEGERADAHQRALVALAADDVARSPAARRELARSESREAELEVLLRRIERRYKQGSARAGRRPTTLGPFELLADLRQGVGEALERAGSLPGYAATRALGPALQGLNGQLAIFMGDILTYLHGRGTPEAPGPIPSHLLAGLARAREIQRARDGEPIVVLSHSMGGQLVYDLVSAFLPRSESPDLREARIDFWCAAASQVGFFQEIKVFLGGGPDDPFGAPPRRPVPFPDRRYLGGWWNVWDPNDYFSFTAEGIFEQVDDFAFGSGLSGLRAHGGYLIQPSFFHHFAARLKVARERGWDRSEL